MTDKDQETGEDYLQLEQYIEEVEAGRPPQPPADLTLEQRRIYRMAAFFCSPFPRAVSPRPEFVEALRVRLLAMEGETATGSVPSHTSRTARCRTRRRGVHHHRRATHS
jgi:hypothetical protein